MKELYISPEVKLLGFVTAEDLAYIGDLDEALGADSSGTVSGVHPDIGDIDISIGL